MTTEIETTRSLMFGLLGELRVHKKHPKLLGHFEDALHSHLEALRQEHGDVLVQLDHANRMTGVYSDAYDRQVLLTKSACVFNREQVDELYRLRGEVESVGKDREDTYESLQEARAKLASGTRTIIALHRVVKGQQKAYELLQSVFDQEMKVCNGIVERAKAERIESHRQIMQAEAISDERWELLDARQKLIVKQRNSIESLTFELASVRKQLEKPSLWARLMGKKRAAKKLPKEI